MTWLIVDGNVVLDACLSIYLPYDMIYGHGCGSCVMQELHAIKILKFYMFWLLQDPHILQVVLEPIIT